MLERANVDYESESQKECQDILDSIDMPAEYNDPNKLLLSRVIPQVDGSSDDLPSTPCSGESPKTEYGEAKPNVEEQSWPGKPSNLSNKHLNRRSRWGSLPVCGQKVSEFSPPKIKEGLGPSWTGNESDKLLPGNTDKKIDTCPTGQTSVIIECSTRDLMRRKRSSRDELSDYRSSAETRDAELCSDGNERDPSSPSKSHARKINSTAEVCNAAIIETSSFPVSGELQRSFCQDGIDAENLPKDGNTEVVDHNISHSGEYLRSTVDGNMNVAVSSRKFEQAHVSNMETLGDVPADHLNDSGSKTTQMQFGSSPYCKRDPGVYEAYDLSKDVDKEAGTVKLIAMTIPKRPPTIDWKDEGNKQAPLFLRNEGSNMRMSIQGRAAADDLLPFFERNFQEEQPPCVSPRKLELVDNHEAVMGVPVLYQNDGSPLYMLTPAMSPPSKQSVVRWLSSDILRHKIDSPSQFPPISDGLSQGSQADDSNFILPESASMPISEKTPKRDQLPERNQENITMEAKAFTETKRKIETSCSPDISQISGPGKKIRLTPLSQIGFRDPASVGQGQQLTLLSVEVQADSRGDLRPDPRFDAINVIVLVLQEDNESVFDTYVLLRCDSANLKKDLDAVSESKTFVFQEELLLFNHFTKLIHAFDPDILMGWDVQSGSLGFLAERAAHLGIGLLDIISRTPSQINISSADFRDSDKEKIPKSSTSEMTHLENSIIEDEWGRTHASGVHVGGRIVLNIWRLMRNEVKLNMYTVEAVAEAVLRRKIPYIHGKVLTRWFSSGPGQARYRTIDYTSERAKLNLQILNQLDMINRTSELARVFGIDFFSVLSRGSQYRVESMFLRLAHTQNYLAISPGTQQVASQPAMECIPLVMEPESRFYADPVIVLDFQSLYPSMVIAYNLCFCTCLGKITPPKAQGLGVSSYSPDSNTLLNLKHELLVAPNGVAYVPSKVRRGILPRLLEEILSTRIMVKQAMKKLAPSQLVRNRILNARQLALKLIANVTYGYTAAGFSGRMPCAELADSIVQCGRRTLETAISFVNSNDKWKARVVYGDTDRYVHFIH